MDIRRIAGTDDLTACMEIRRRVFMDEQGVTEEEEWDGFDEACTHFLALDPTPVATARLRVAEDGTAKAERVAVLIAWRKKGVGAAVMRALEAEAARAGHAEIQLGAQVHALPFYEGLGYVAFGPEFDDARIPHRMMKKALSVPG